MTLRLHEPTVRQLYKWWRQGAISMYAAGKCLGCEPRTVMRRWAEWDAHCREVIRRRETAAVLARQRRAEKSTRLWTNASVANEAHDVSYDHWNGTETPCNHRPAPRSA